MRRLLTGVLAVAICASTGAVANAQPLPVSPNAIHRSVVANQQPHVPDWLRDQCRFAGLDHRSGYSVPEVHRTIRCSVWRWWRGHIGTVNCIADRESGFWPGADNPSSSASGVFQIVAGTWEGWRFRTEPYGWRGHAWRFRLSESVFDGRANVMIAVWQMSAYGTAAWGGAC